MLTWNKFGSLIGKWVILPQGILCQISGPHKVKMFPPQATNWPDENNLNTCSCCRYFDAWISVSSIYDGQFHQLPLLQLIFSISLKALKKGQRQDRLLFSTEAWHWPGNVLRLSCFVNEIYVTFLPPFFSPFHSCHTRSYILTFPDNRSVSTPFYMP